MTSSSPNNQEITLTLTRDEVALLRTALVFLLETSTRHEHLSPEIKRLIDKLPS